MWFKSARSDGSHASGAAGRRAAPSILSEDVTLEGDIVTEGELHVAGAVKGNIASRKLTLAEGGSITGTIETETAVINGALNGRLAAVTVMLGRTARVVGDIIHVSMRMEPGAVFEGYSRRVDSVNGASEEAGRLPAPRPAVTGPRGAPEILDHAEAPTP
jgi:cytoskeletal protein CcmA (bactofilin family)